MALEDCNCMSLRRAARGVSNLYDAMLSPSGLRATQYSILAALKQLGAFRSTTSPIVSTSIGRQRQDLRPLTLAGLVRIRPSPTDEEVASSS